MSDIVARLHSFAESFKRCFGENHEFILLNDANAEILRLRAENEKLRAALKRWEDTGLQKDWPITYDGCEAAALKETGDD